jgi:hypothetical protein
MIPALAVFAVLVGVLGWLFLASRSEEAGPRAPRRRGDVDEAELEAAERDVRDAADEDDVKDWGPGVAQQRPRPPEYL